MFESTRMLAVLISFLMLAQAYVIRLAVGTYIFPAALLSLAWFLFTIAPLTVLTNVPVNPLSVLYIFVCVLAFSLSALPFGWRKAFKANTRKTASDRAQFNSGFMHYVFYIASASSVVFSTISVTANGVDLHSMIFDLMKTSGRYAAMRGQGELEYTAWGILGIFFTYATALLGGALSGQGRTRLRAGLILFLAFAPSVYYMLTQSAKLTVFFSVGFYVASVLLKKIYANKLALLGWSAIPRLAGIAALILPLILISFVSREGFGEYNDAAELLGKVATLVNSYALGQVYAFSDFFASYLGMKSEVVYIHDFHSNGYYTFKSIFDMLGGHKYFPPGTFQDVYSHENVIATNVFTIFRGLIYDFGGVGTVGVMFVGGLVVHSFFYRLLTRRASWVACGVFMVSVVFIQGTYLFSIFTARYIFLQLVAFVAILWLNAKYWKRESSHHLRLSGVSTGSQCR